MTSPNSRDSLILITEKALSSNSTSIKKKTGSNRSKIDLVSIRFIATRIHIGVVSLNTNFFEARSVFICTDSTHLACSWLFCSSVDPNEKKICWNRSYINKVSPGKRFGKNGGRCLFLAQKHGKNAYL